MPGPSGQTDVYDIPYPIPDDTVDVPRDIKAAAERVEDVFSPFFPGMVMGWPAPAAPAGWLLAQGQGNVPAADHPGLVALFGQTGGFVNMPDYRDKFLVGAGGTMALGSVGGAASVALSPNEMPVHNHGGWTGAEGTPDHLHTSPTAYDHAHTPYGAGAGGLWYTNQNWGQGGVAFQTYVGAGANWLYYINTTSSNPHAQAATTGAADRSLAHQHSIPSAGAGWAHENRPPYKAINYIIKGG